MGGYRLWIIILPSIALTLGIIMAALGIYNSWSEHALMPEAPLLTATLSFIFCTFLLRSFSHTERYKTLFTVKKMEYRIQHSNRVTWALFLGVLMFPVTAEEIWIQNLHLIFTGAAIASAYTELIFYYKKGGPIFWGNIMGISLGAIGFFIGWISKVYSVSVGEVLASIPIIIYILVTNKNNHGTSN